MTRVVDYSFFRPSLAQLQAWKASGVVAVSRYLSVVTDATRGKILTRTEADFIRGAGLDVVSNWEYDAHDALGGYGMGHTYAQQAAQQHADAGGPTYRPIIWSCDFQVSTAQLPQVRGYARGWHDTIGNRAWAYAQANVLDDLASHGLIGGGWQISNSWSGDRTSRVADLAQVAWGDSYDWSNVLRNDFGQWGYVAAQGKDDDMKNVIVRWEGHPHLILTDSHEARWLVDEGHRGDEVYAQAHYFGNTMPGEPYPEVADLRTLGVFCGPVPRSMVDAGARINTAAATVVEGQ